MLYHFVAYKDSHGVNVMVTEWAKSFDSDEDAAEYIIDFNCMLVEIGSDVMVTSFDIPFETMYDYKICQPTMELES